MNCADKDCSCPFFQWLNIFERKWNLRIVRELYKRGLGFNELKKRIPGITQGVLSARLDELQAAGLVVRKAVKKKPLEVQYLLDGKIRGALECWTPLNKNDAMS